MNVGNESLLLKILFVLRIFLTCRQTISLGVKKFFKLPTRRGKIASNLCYDKTTEVPPASAFFLLRLAWVGGGGIAVPVQAQYYTKFSLRGGDMALTPKQERFVQEYLVDLNATAAAKRAGYSEKTAGEQAARLLTNVKIQLAIQEAQKLLRNRTEITQDMVIRETAKLAFFDIRKMFDKDGKPLDISNLDDDTAAALVGLDVQDVYEFNNDEKQFIGYIKKYKMADKLKALELLGKRFGTWEPQNKQQTAVEDLTALAEKLRV